MEKYFFVILLDVFGVFDLKDMIDLFVLWELIKIGIYI